MIAIQIHHLVVVQPDPDDEIVLRWKRTRTVTEHHVEAAIVGAGDHEIHGPVSVDVNRRWDVADAAAAA